MKRPSRRVRLSATTMLKNGRALAPPRESRMTTMIYPSGGRAGPVVREAPTPSSPPAFETRATATRPATRWKACDYSPPCPMPLIRPSTEADLPAITAIYGHHVLHGTGTFETTPPTEAEMAGRRSDVLAKGLPWLVAEDGGRVLGYAYCQWFK